MKTFIAHLLLTIIAAVLARELVSLNLSGIAEFCLYVAFMLVLWLTSFLYHRRYFYQFWHSILLYFYFTGQLITSNLQIIRFIVTPGKRFRPAILELPLDVQSEAGIVLLANMITLTPGTLTLRVSKDRKKLYFHTVNVVDGDIDKARQQIKDGLEKRIMAISS